MSGVLSVPPGLLLKRIFLLFWAMYFSMVAITNAIDLMGELDIFDWTFLNSQNYEFVRSVVQVYDVGPDLSKLMLAGAFAIELTGAILFWRALLAYGSKPGGARKAYQALCWAAVVWFSFVFMTEFFVAYSAEGPFRELLMLLIATAIAIALIPNNAGEDANALS